MKVIYTGKTKRFMGAKIGYFKVDGVELSCPYKGDPESEEVKEKIIAYAEKNK